MTLIIIFLMAFIILMSISISNDNWNTLRIYKRQSSKRKILILCIIGYIIFIMISITFASLIIEPAFGNALSMVYSFLAGAGIYLFWFFRYKKMVNKNQIIN